MRSGRRTGLDRDDVVAAALDLVERGGRRRAHHAPARPPSSTWGRPPSTGTSAAATSSSPRSSALQAEPARRAGGRRAHASRARLQRRPPHLDELDRAPGHHVAGPPDRHLVAARPPARGRAGDRARGRRPHRPGRRRRRPGDPHDRRRGPGPRAPRPRRRTPPSTDPTRCGPTATRRSHPATRAALRADPDLDAHLGRPRSEPSSTTTCRRDRTDRDRGASHDRRTPMTRPGEVAGWPKLVVTYTTDPAGIAAAAPARHRAARPDGDRGLLLRAGARRARVRRERQGAGGVAGRRGPVQPRPRASTRRPPSTSAPRRTGSPSSSATIAYFRLGDAVTARATHQGYTFVEFSGRVGRRRSSPEPATSPSTSGGPSTRGPSAAASGSYDFPPHVVDVATTFEQRHVEDVDGALLLRDSPWDPIARYLPDRRGGHRAARHPPAQGAGHHQRRPARPRGLLALRRRHRREPLARRARRPRRLTRPQRTPERHAAAQPKREEVPPWAPPPATTSSSPPTATAAPASTATSRSSRRSYHDDFDAWAADFENPYDDNTGADADRNWSSERRLREMEADGVVAEVIFPNTIPPFFPKVSLVNQPPGRDRRRPRQAVGRPAGAQPVDGRLLQPGARPPGRHRPDHAPRRRRVGDARSSGPRTTGSPAASCCPAPRPARACRRCTPPTTSRSGPRARTSACRSATTAAAPCPTWGPTPRPR